KPLRIESLWHNLYRPIEQSRQLRGRPTIADQRIGLSKIGDVAMIRFAQQGYHDGNVFRAEPRRLMQSVRVDDVRLPLPGRNPAPHGAAEPLLIEMEGRHGQTSEPAPHLVPVH